jgi:hypothetical protein
MLLDRVCKSGSYEMGIYLKWSVGLAVALLVRYVELRGFCLQPAVIALTSGVASRLRARKPAMMSEI